MDQRSLLEQLIAGPHSGVALARARGVSRAAIWKAIEGLRAAGVDIDSRAGHGYVLSQPLELLDRERILHGLPTAVRGQLAGLEVRWSVDSTNSALLREETPPMAGCRVLLAERQTVGRGRRGRIWRSPLAAHLYLSCARRFEGGLGRLGGLSLVAGVAVARALHGLGFMQIRLKWPNDLVFEDAGSLHKLGGLLVEGSGEQAGHARAVIGLGLNVRMPAAEAARIDQPWCDLATLAATPPSRNALAAAVLAELLPALERFERDGLEPTLYAYRALDALQDREVQIHDNDGDWGGRALGLSADGGLRVATAGGERIVHAADVSLRLA